MEEYDESSSSDGEGERIKSGSEVKILINDDINAIDQLLP